MNISTDINKEPESFVQVRFQDCDPFGHLNNARYVDYFLNARMDHLQQFYGVNIYDREKPMTASWVIKQSQISYLRPAVLAEEVRIRTRLIHGTTHSIVVEGLMLDKEARQLKALSWVEFAYISLTTGRPTAHTEEWQQLIQAVAIPDQYDADGFNRRVEAVREQFRKRATIEGLTPVI